MALWKPTPKDIYKSRWKRFYKRCYRLRSPFNMPDRPPPHEQGNHYTDGVPSPWKLNYSLQNFAERVPPDGMRLAQLTYAENHQRFMAPARACKAPLFQDAVLRCLDAGRRGGGDSGYGRAEVEQWAAEESEAGPAKTPELVPRHVYVALQAAAARGEAAGGPPQRSFALSGEGFLASLRSETRSDVFPVRRLYALCEEKELVWEGGQPDPSRRQKRLSTDPEGGAAKVDRGRFPYVDEQASLIDELGLREILRLRHRTNSRRHPKWLELRYWYKKWHRQYLRRRQMLKDEVKERMGILKQALPQA